VSPDLALKYMDWLDNARRARQAASSGIGALRLPALHPGKGVQLKIAHSPALVTSTAAADFEDVNLGNGAQLLWQLQQYGTWFFAKREVAVLLADGKPATMFEVTVKWAFEAYADGDRTLRRLLAELRERGLTNRPGPRTPAKPIGKTVLHRMLTNPYYIGVVIYQGVSYPGKHEPLISTQLFERVQSALKAHNCAGERQYVHNHYLKGSIFCGTCGSRLAVTNSRNRHGTVYDYFYCLGRQYNPQSCTWSVVRLRKVEQLVVDHYRTVQLPPERIAEVRDVLKQALSTRRVEAEAAEQSLTLRIQRLTDERQKLLQLHYAEAVPVDLGKDQLEPTPLGLPFDHPLAIGHDLRQSHRFLGQ